MIQSRITSKAQTTLPRAVRDALGIGPGDRVVWEVEKGRATLRRLALVDPRDPFVNNFSTFTEWADDLDEEAFRDL
jgi:antitoxin PrlF